MTFSFLFTDLLFSTQSCRLKVKSALLQSTELQVTVTMGERQGHDAVKIITIPLCSW